MKLIPSLFAALLITFSTTIAQIPSISDFKTDSTAVTTGISFKFHSKSMDEDRTVMIGLPQGYEKSTKKYPVFYLLDGQWAFDITKQCLDWLSNPQYGMIPEMIVVSIHTGGDTRARDLTPTQDRNSKSGGGADKLYQFIRNELIPFVDQNYRTYNYRVLGGASFGGVFVMHAFHTDPQLFNGYISLSPSMWWDGNILLDRTRELLIKNPNLKSRLFTSVTNEGISMGVDSLASILTKYAPKTLAWKFDKHTDEVHETVAFKGYWDGMKFIMSEWQYPLGNFGTKEKPAIANDSAAYGKVSHKSTKLSDDELKSRSGLYIDNYKRTFALIKIDNRLQLESSSLPTLTLYPETPSKFFLNKSDIQNKLYLKGYDVLFEFPQSDSLVITANGKTDCTAKKTNCPPIIKLSASTLDKYVGAYSAAPRGSFRVTIEADQLVITEGVPPTHLYPIAENKFYGILGGNGYEIEFANEDQALKMKILMNGKALLEAKKTN